MIANGEKIELQESVSVAEYLRFKGYNFNHIAVELDEEIISKSDYETTMLKNDSVLEVVQFMGGGSN